MTVKPLLGQSGKLPKPYPEFVEEVTTSKKVLLFCLLFVLPFIGIAVLTLSNVYRLERSSFLIGKGVVLDEVKLNAWEKRYGSFVRERYLERVEEPVESRDHQEVNWGLPYPPVPDQASCQGIDDGLKFDCFPRGPVTEKECSQRGCCYTNVTASKRDPKVPICYYPRNYTSYQYAEIKSESSRITASMTAQFRSPYPSDIVKLRLSISFLSDDTLMLAIDDFDKARFRPPLPEEPVPGTIKDPLYEVKIDSNSTGFQILRKATNKIIFDTKDLGGFIYSDQLMQISSRLPSKFVYGIGEQRNNFLRDINWNTIPLFAHDSLPLDHVNGYGVQPIYLCMEEGGTSNGVVFLNSNPMDIILQPGPAITYRAIGGVLAFFIALGPSPVQVVQQMSMFLGPPALPPFWGLGFHLSRFGYKDLNDMARVWNQTVQAKIPFDTQWADLDYMKNRNDFTLSDQFKGLDKFVENLHSMGMHFVPIIDPGISASEAAGTYPPYDEGIAQDIFIKDHTGKKPFIGKVWNSNSTVFVDFFNPKAVSYWMDQLEKFHKLVPFDGAWIDMNEPSNFLNGSVSGCPNNKLDYPGYVPSIDGGLLSYRTVCMSALHSGSVPHYNHHNMYGTVETVVTSFALSMLRGTRPFVISRSSFLGHGKFGGHWTGDVRSTWDDMKHSVADILSFSVFGVPLVGADICGFNGNTSAALCQRWSQLGAFYPFSRNHNSDDATAQDPVSLGEGVTKAAKTALTIRYMLLPYLYSLFWEAHLNGTPVVQPLFFQFPKDPATYSIVTQFMWGRSLLIAPVLEEGMTYVNVYLGEGVWFNANTKDRIVSKGQSFVAPAPLDTIPLFVRGGSIIPEQMIGYTTQESRTKPLMLNVALDNDSKAEGKLYWDDGESLDYNYDLIEFKASGNRLTSQVKIWNYDTDLPLQIMHIYPVGKIQNVTLDSVSIPFKYKDDIKNLILENLNLKLNHEFTIVWQ